MGRISLAKMTDEAIDQEIAELEANPRPVQGTYTRLENLRGEKTRRLQSKIVDIYADMDKIDKLKMRLDNCKSFKEINEVRAEVDKLKDT